ncbi:Adenylate and Guanylate cyclase catalytic domain containing protein [Novymonas esmeraldas]|uniref:Adenylate and Guanylate cyclase catalytic domain containing protein n=1 Tax=Novymonas esmeraldas TaxID=1808958 RepID=A0AAW0ES18_9TRYP
MGVSLSVPRQSGGVRRRGAAATASSTRQRKLRALHSTQEDGGDHSLPASPHTLPGATAAHPHTSPVCGRLRSPPLSASSYTSTPVELPLALQGGSPSKPMALFRATSPTWMPKARTDANAAAGAVRLGSDSMLSPMGVSASRGNIAEGRVSGAVEGVLALSSSAGSLRRATVVTFEEDAVEPAAPARMPLAGLRSPRPATSPVSDTENSDFPDVPTRRGTAAVDGVASAAACPAATPAHVMLAKNVDGDVDADVPAFFPGPGRWVDSDTSSTQHSSSSGGSSSAQALLVSQQMAQAGAEWEVLTANTRIVLRSWELVSVRYDEFIHDLSGALLAPHPEYAQLFIASSPTAQTRVIMNMIGEALMIMARPDEMYTALLEMGAVHRRYNVGEEHFRALQSAFMSILPKYLPEEMRSTCDAAWTTFWKVVVQLLVHGRESARGDWHAAEQQKLFLAESRKVLASVAASGGAAGPELFMTELLERAAVTYPALEQSPLMRDRSVLIRAFNGIMRLLLGLDDMARSVALMEELSLQESAATLDGAAMQLLRQPFIDTCRRAVRVAKRLELWTPQTKRSLGAFWDYAAEMWDTARTHAHATRSAQAQRAPDGSQPFCMMFTDIEASTRLWEHNPTVMGEAVEAHHRIVRSAIADYGAYEVKTVGDSFVIAAKDALIALKIALAIQLELMRGPIVPGFEMVDGVQGSGPAECWRNDSLRVRIGIHYCRDAAAVYDSVQHRFDYYGPSVNCTARTESTACGGQILMTRDALEAVQDERDFNVAATAMSAVPGAATGDTVSACVAEIRALAAGTRAVADMVVVQDWGEHTFKGIARHVQLFAVAARSLTGRTFQLPSTSLGSSMVSSRVGGSVVLASGSFAGSALSGAAASDVEEVFLA